MVETRNCDSTPPGLHLGEHPREDDRRIDHPTPNGTLMQFNPSTAHVELKKRQTTKYVAYQVNPAIEQRGIRYHDDVGSQLLLMGPNELIEVDTAHHSLAL